MIQVFGSRRRVGPQIVKTFVEACYLHPQGCPKLPSSSG